MVMFIPCASSGTSSSMLSGCCACPVSSSSFLSSHSVFPSAALPVPGLPCNAALQISRRNFRAVLIHPRSFPALTARYGMYIFSLVLAVLMRLAHFWFNACAEMARQSWIYAFIFPAWVVELNSRNSIVPFWNTLCRFRQW